jgi:hypothetical protein
MSGSFEDAILINSTKLLIELILPKKMIMVIFLGKEGHFFSNQNN